MEALVILLGEVLYLLRLLVLLVIGGIAVILVSLLADFALPRLRDGMFGERLRDWWTTLEPWRELLAQIRTAILYALLAMAIGIPLANHLLFAPAMRLVMAFAERRSQIATTFETASGDLFAGTLRLGGVSARRQFNLNDGLADERGNFDLKAGRVSAQIDMTTLMDSTALLKSLSVENAGGTFRQREPRRIFFSRDNGGQIRGMRKFHVERLELRQIEVAFWNKNGDPVSISLKTVATPAFRSDYALFDMLLRSDVAGQLNGRDFTFSVRSSDGRPISQWRMPNQDAAAISRLITQQPVGWFAQGSLSLDVDHRWQQGQRPAFRSDWALRLRDLNTQMPKAESGWDMILAQDVMDYIKAKGGDVDLRFSTDMDESRFENISWLDVYQLWTPLMGLMETAIAGGSDEDAARFRASVEDRPRRRQEFARRNRNWYSPGRGE